MSVEKIFPVDKHLIESSIGSANLKSLISVSRINKRSPVSLLMST